MHSFAVYENTGGHGNESPRSSRLGPLYKFELTLKNILSRLRKKRGYQRCRRPTALAMAGTVHSSFPRTGFRGAKPEGQRNDVAYQKRRAHCYRMRGTRPCCPATQGGNMSMVWVALPAVGAAQAQYSVTGLLRRGRWLLLPARRGCRVHSRSGCFPLPWFVVNNQHALTGIVLFYSGLVRQRTSSRLAAGNETPRTRQAAEWLETVDTHIERAHSYLTPKFGSPGRNLFAEQIAGGAGAAFFAWPGLDDDT